MAPITDGAPITDALITHSNGDHTHGNQLLDESVRVIAATGTAEEIEHGIAPEMLVMAKNADLGPVATPYLRERFGPFDFSGITLRNADQTFDDRAHHRGRRTTGGVAESRSGAYRRGFGGACAGCGGVVRRGPAVHRLHADRVVRPDRELGGGVRCDDRARRRDRGAGSWPGDRHRRNPRVRGYLVHIAEQAEAAYRKGLSFVEAAEAIDLGEYEDWLDAERVVINVYHVTANSTPAHRNCRRWACWRCKPTGSPNAADA